MMDAVYRLQYNQPFFHLYFILRNKIFSEQQFVVCEDINSKVQTVQSAAGTGCFFVQNGGKAKTKTLRKAIRDCH